MENHKTPINLPVLLKIYDSP